MANGIFTSGLVIVGVMVALVVYEVLLRKALPRQSPSQGFPQGNGSVEKGGYGRGWRHRIKISLAFLSGFLERIAPETSFERGQRQNFLARAGLSLSCETWRSIRIISLVVGGVLGFVLVGIVPNASLMVGISMVAIGSIVGWAIPRIFSSWKERRRIAALSGTLPDAMELLSIALAAGSPLEQCFREVALNIEGPLAQEFSLVDQEVNFLGHTREKALENLASRCQGSEVGAFVAQMTQAITQGSSVASDLSTQAALARERMQASLLERIRKMPTKLDIVLSLCFLPPTVALVVVPTVVNLLHFLNDSMR